MPSLWRRPPILHFEQVCAAARAGKHVYCEKPFTLDLASALEAVRICEETGVTLGVAFTHRLHPAMRQLYEIVRGGELGTILHATGNYSHNWLPPSEPTGWRALPASSPAGTLFFTGNGVHTLDALIGLFGRVVQADAKGQRRVPTGDLLDVVSAYVHFESGPAAAITSVHGTPSIWRIEVFGTEGWAEVRDWHTLTVKKRGDVVRSLTFPPAPVLKDGLESFATAVRKEGSHFVSIDDVLAGVAAYEAIIASLKCGSSIRVNDAVVGST